MLFTTTSMKRSKRLKLLRSRFRLTRVYWPAEKSCRRIWMLTLRNSRDNSNLLSQTNLNRLRNRNWLRHCGLANRCRRKAPPPRVAESSQLLARRQHSKKTRPLVILVQVLITSLRPSGMSRTSVSAGPHLPKTSGCRGERKANQNKSWLDLW